MLFMRLSLVAALFAGPVACVDDEPVEEMVKIEDSKESTKPGFTVDKNGVVWVGLAGSVHLASFDRRKCRVLNGPTPKKPLPICVAKTIGRSSSRITASTNC